MQRFRYSGYHSSEDPDEFGSVTITDCGDTLYNRSAHHHRIRIYCSVIGDADRAETEAIAHRIVDALNNEERTEERQMNTPDMPSLDQVHATVRGSFVLRGYTHVGISTKYDSKYKINVGFTHPLGARFSVDAEADNTRDLLQALNCELGVYAGPWSERPVRKAVEQLQKELDNEKNMFKEYKKIMEEEDNQPYGPRGFVYKG